MVAWWPAGESPGVTSDDLAGAVGARIRRLRKAADLSIEELAGKAGVGTVYLGSVERGAENPTLKVLGGVAEALGVSVSKLTDVDAELTPKDVRREIKARLDRAAPDELHVVLRILDAIRE